VLTGEKALDRVTKVSPSPPPTDAPASDVVEVNLFGPGYGESILMHLGSNHWIVVDSCAPDDEAEPAALAYLRQIGVKASEVIKYIVATHWHDDHIRGFSSIVSACPQAEVFLSSALTHRPFMRLVLVNAPRHVTNLREMNRTIRTLNGRRQQLPVQPYSFVLENTALHSNLLHPNNEVEVWALSPSSSDVKVALSQIGHFLPQEDRLRLPAIPDPKENRTSIVLYIRSGNQRVLFGADREKQKAKTRGWNSVAACATKRGFSPATLFKVAHHGSPNGDSDVIWSDLLEEDSVAMLTPFRRGTKGGRPRPTDISALCSRTKWAFTTSDVSASSTAYRRPAAIGIRAEDAAMGVQALGPAQLPLGHVRARAGMAGGPWSIDLVRPGAYLCG
jgi:hypothetical protein